MSRDTRPLSREPNSLGTPSIVPEPLRSLPEYVVRRKSVSPGRHGKQNGFTPPPAEPAPVNENPSPENVPLAPPLTPKAVKTPLVIGIVRASAVALTSANTDTRRAIRDLFIPLHSTAGFAAVPDRCTA